MIGITGVTGKLGFMWLILSISKEFLLSIWQEAQSVQSLRQREIRKMVYANTPEVVEALKGNRCLIDGLCSENPERVEEHKEFF